MTARIFQGGPAGIEEVEESVIQKSMAAWWVDREIEILSFVSPFSTGEHYLKIDFSAQYARLAENENDLPSELRAELYRFLAAATAADKGLAVAAIKRLNCLRDHLRAENPVARESLPWLKLMERVAPNAFQPELRQVVEKEINRIEAAVSGS